MTAHISVAPVRRGPVTWADRLLIYIVLGTGLVLLFLPHAEDGGAVRITGADGFRLEVPFGTGMTFDVPGPLGTTVVEVGESGARVVSSPCPNKLCIAMGPADAPGRSAVCVPNGVIVTVVGAEGRERAADVITR